MLKELNPRQREAVDELARDLRATLDRFGRGACLLEVEALALVLSESALELCAVAKASGEPDIHALAASIVRVCRPDLSKAVA